MKEGDEKNVYEVLNEIFDLIDQGYHMYPRLIANKLYLYNELNKSKVVDLSRFNKKEQKAIHEKAKEYAKKRREELEDEEEEKEEKEEKKEKKRGSSYQQAGTGRKVTLEALDRSHAKIVQNVTERVTWFADVLNEIGFYATLLAMQVAKVPPEELYTKVAEFKDPQSFIVFVREYLNALFEAKEEAQEIIKYRNKLDVMDMKLALLEEVIEQLKQQRDQATIALYAAVSTMDEEQLRNFVLNMMVAQYGLGVKVPNLYNNMNIGGVEVGGAGRADGEGVGEEEEHPRGTSTGTS